LKKNVANISEARASKPIENHVASLESLHNNLQQSSQCLQDPIADMLDNICSQIPLADYEPTNRDDKNLIRKPSSLYFLVGVSLKSFSENLQLNHKLYDDVDNICAIPNYDLEFVEYSEHRETGHVCHDSIAIYMKEFFTS
jgi:hypothetical protein